MASRQTAVARGPAVAAGLPPRAAGLSGDIPAPRRLGNALEWTLRLVSPRCPPGGAQGRHRRRCALPVHGFLSPPTPPHGGSADRCAPGWRRLCRCCLPLCFPSSLLPRLRTRRRWALWRQGLARHGAPAGYAWDGRMGGPQQQRQVVLVAGAARAGVERRGNVPWGVCTCG